MATHALRHCACTHVKRNKTNLNKHHRIEEIEKPEVISRYTKSIVIFNSKVDNNLEQEILTRNFSASN
jgi:hypothetical protein